MKTYLQKLGVPLWRRKRVHILERDNFKCVRCGETCNLNVHHKKYILGKEPWEYPDDLLETLCENCHRNEHGIETETHGFTKEEVAFLEKAHRAINEGAHLIRSDTGEVLQDVEKYLKDNR